MKIMQFPWLGNKRPAEPEEIQIVTTVRSDFIFLFKIIKRTSMIDIFKVPKWVIEIISGKQNV